jgi:hypothetical protein
MIRIASAAVLGVALLMIAGCASTPATPAAQGFKHVAGLDCGSCHKAEFALWSSPNDLHAASASTILGVADHNRNEVPKDDCLLCHAMFQAISLHAVVDTSGTVTGTKIPKSAYGPVDDPTQTYYSGAISHFVSPINAKGPWTVTNGADWRATKCEVCHDPSSTDLYKLAKYGAWLDSQPQAAYIQLNTGMPVAYNFVFQKKGFVQTTYKDQSAISIHATKLCDSCHDPNDEGSDPAKIIHGVNYGPQGGDSRAYVTASHANLGCIDCHKTHDFTPETLAQAVTDPNCIGLGCHNLSAPAPKSPGDPGVVHVNHIP